ncbi:MAG: hypothetical protein L6Q54_01970 [Leptospiraceae bacterium]|nr:hypothetical protein [Leptospiraceae bacterium]NUM40151.1 hypothetical protein [Leptospiraceae bacterium]
MEIFSQQLDPLLQNSWIQEVSDEEEKFYNRLSTIINKTKSLFIKEDFFGREYKIKKNGTIAFQLNDFYRDVFPDFSQLDIHLSESEVLSENGNFIQGIRLLKGINLCNRSMIKNSITDKLRNYDSSTNLLNTMYKRFSHKENEIQILTDPYGCYITEKKELEKNLLIESEAFAFRFQIGKEFEYNFPDRIDDMSGKESDYEWKFFRLIKRDPKQKEKSSGFEEELKKSESFVKKIRDAKIIFFAGMTFHNTNLVYTKDNYYQLWDIRRGLTKNRIREIHFKREKVGNYYESNFYDVNEFGEKKNKIVKEKYYLRKNKGLFFSLSYPLEKKSEAEDEWNLFLKTLDVK